MQSNSSPNQDSSVIRASKLDTATISDALDRLGIAGQCLNIKPRDPSFRLTGRAFTMLYRPVGKPAGHGGRIHRRCGAGLRGSD